MLYYLGKGTEFKKEDCKEYKKLDAALKAAAKDERQMCIRDRFLYIFRSRPVGE